MTKELRDTEPPVLGCILLSTSARITDEPGIC